MHNADPAALAAAIYNRKTRKMDAVPGAVHDAPSHRIAHNGSRMRQSGQPLPQAYPGDRPNGRAQAAPFGLGHRSNGKPQQTADKADAKEKILAALMATGMDDRTPGRNAEADRPQGLNRRTNAQKKMASRENPFLTGGQNAVLRALMDRQIRQT